MTDSHGHQETAPQKHATTRDLVLNGVLFLCIGLFLLVLWSCDPERKRHGISGSSADLAEVQSALVAMNTKLNPARNPSDKSLTALLRPKREVKLVYYNGDEGFIGLEITSSLPASEGIALSDMAEVLRDLSASSIKWSEVDVWMRIPGEDIYYGRQMGMTAWGRWTKGALANVNWFSTKFLYDGSGIRSVAKRYEITKSP